MRRSIIQVFVLLLCISAQGQVPMVNVAMVHNVDLFSLEARDCSLHDTLEALSKETGLKFNYQSISNRHVDVRYLDRPLDEVLYGLGVDFVLEYERSHKAGAYELAAAALFQGEGIYSRTSLQRAIEMLRATYGREFDELYQHIKNLNDDDIPWNALKSQNALIEEGMKVVPLLDHALLAGDRQAQEMAVDVLYWLRDEYEPSPRFLEILVDGLHDDTIPGASEDGFEWRNAKRGYRYFSDHPEHIAGVKDELVRGLYSEDGQFRLLSASLLAQSKEASHAPRIVEVLAMHMKNNDLGADARLGIYSLYHFGEAARPHLARYLSSEDKQQRESVVRVFEAWEKGGEYFTESSYPHMGDWVYDRFPDNNGNYPKVTPRG